MLGCLQQQSAKQGQDARMFGRFVLPGIDDSHVVAKEADALTGPKMTPCQDGRHDGKELLPLD